MRSVLPLIFKGKLTTRGQKLPALSNQPLGLRSWVFLDTISIQLPKPQPKKVREITIAKPDLFKLTTTYVRTDVTT